jgi:hypothetical protein
MDGSVFVPDLLEGDLANCGLALERCQSVSGRICFIERGGATFAVKAINCEHGGNIGLIIYNNVGSSVIVGGTLGGIEVGIPVFSISRSAGRALSSASLPSITIDVRPLVIVHPQEQAWPPHTRLVSSPGFGASGQDLERQARMHKRASAGSCGEYGS